jgi:hypothetical protein
VATMSDAEKVIMGAIVAILAAAAVALAVCCG